ncbi:MAG: sigma 54-interacting transcriptional regulator [Acidobacteriota bacterium]
MTDLDLIAHGSPGDVIGTCSIPLSAWCRWAMTLIDADGCGIILRFPDELRYVAGNGFQWYKIAPVAPEQSLFAGVITDGRSIVCDDVRLDGKLAASPEAALLDMGAFIASPIMSGDGLLGIVAVHSKAATRWQQAQINRIEGFAHALALFMSGALQCYRYRVPPPRPLTPSEVSTSPIVRSGSTQAVFAEAREVAKFSFPVLILGERGTGKGVLAEYIHSVSHRKGSFITVNCAAVPHEMIEDALFGHRKGAFTGALSDRGGHVEAADGGTLFLDEIGDLRWEAQAKLLRLIESNEIQRLGEDTSRYVNVRIISATNRPVKPDGQDRVLREDLYDRLAGYVLHMPPLRERVEDLEALIDLLLHKLTVDTHKPLSGISTDARELLLRYRWPGNIRELENVLRGACVRARAGVAIGVECLPQDLIGRALSGPASAPEIVDEKPRHRPQTVTDSGLAEAFQEHGGNISRIAADLGVTRQTVQKRLRRLGL